MTFASKISHLLNYNVKTFLERITLRRNSFAAAKTKKKLRKIKKLKISSDARNRFVVNCQVIIAQWLARQLAIREFGVWLAAV